MCDQGGLRRERDGVDADLDAAAAQARLTGLSPGPDPDATSPAERKLADCSVLWSGTTGLAEARGDKPFAAAVRALQKRGWKLASRQQDGAFTQAVLAKGEWTVKGKLSESDRIDRISFAGYHSSCAKDIAALPGIGPKA
ncbi:hypothetical protein [Streptomyces sp. BPTC-684]|uniref:hypothetical protein n=1 Tax=Streptomyces sp. BPTC-684 TaxID=3043734 RepID=UPI0024B12CA9|nr:hypothetical protein [Streptomyces sp. BPTC-684]WHM40883.1 hypothetical protein QIY60_31055 [Streptomyces sp. BPTC-684]